MSLPLLRSSWEANCRSGTAKLVLLCLADHANKDGKSWPSITRIAERCNLSRRCVLSNISALEEDGLIVSKKEKGKGTIYTLQLVNEMHQCISDTGERDAQTGEPDAPPLVNEVHELVNEVHSNHIEPPKEPPRTKGRAKFDPRSQPLPHGVQFRESWESWAAHRTEIHKPLTKTSCQQQLSKLGKLSEENAIATINQSIENGWQGLFELKKLNGHHQKPSRPKHDPRIRNL